MLHADTKANRCESAIALIRLEMIKEGMKESFSRWRGGKHLVLIWGMIILSARL